MYTERILSTNSTSSTGSMTNTMQDVFVATFCVPIVDKHSSLTNAIISDIHWNDKVAQHSTVETEICTQKSLYRQKHQKIMSKVQIPQKENY